MLKLEMAKANRLHFKEIKKLMLYFIQLERIVDAIFLCVHANWLLVLVGDT